MDAPLYTQVVLQLESSVNERTFYLCLYPLRDDASSPATLANRIRDAKALYYEEYTADDEHDETDVLSPHWSGVPNESKHFDQLRSAIVQTRRWRAGRSLVMSLLFAVIVIASVLTVAVSWFNF